LRIYTHAHHPIPFANICLNVIFKLFQSLKITKPRVTHRFSKDFFFSFQNRIRKKKKIKQIFFFKALLLLLYFLKKREKKMAEDLIDDVDFGDEVAGDLGGLTEAELLDSTGLSDDFGGDDVDFMAAAPAQAQAQAAPASAAAVSFDENAFDGQDDFMQAAAAATPFSQASDDSNTIEEQPVAEVGDVPQASSSSSSSSTSSVYTSGLGGASSSALAADSGFAPVDDAPLREWQRKHADALAEKQRESAARHKEVVDAAQQLIAKFFKEREANAAQRAAENRAKQAPQIAAVPSADQVWSNVATLCDFEVTKRGDGADTTRMRDILEQLVN
jgi:Clathrin light chain